VDSPLVVERDTVWNGRRFIGPEPFYLARYPEDRPSLERAGLMLDEQVNLVGHAWLTLDELPGLTGRLEPPELADVVSSLLAR
jgi:hypothetical protein